MNLFNLILHVYLPLLTQESAIMISAFTYGLDTGFMWPLLLFTNCVAVVTDLAVFFVPAHSASVWLHDKLESRYEDQYQRGVMMVRRVGAFRTAVVLGFVMPSVLAMLIVGMLRLSFWRAFSGLFVGSAAYVAIPLLIALPLSKSLPNFLVPILPWFTPAVVVCVVLVYAINAVRHRRQHTDHVEDRREPARSPSGKPL